MTAETSPVRLALGERRRVWMTCTFCWGSGRRPSATTTTDDGPCLWCGGRGEIAYDR